MLSDSQIEAGAPACSRRLTDAEIDALARKTWRVISPKGQLTPTLYWPEHIYALVRAVEAQSSKPSKAMVEAAAREIHHELYPLIDYDTRGKGLWEGYAERVLQAARRAALSTPEVSMLVAEKARCEK